MDARRTTYLLKNVGGCCARIQLYHWAREKAGRAGKSGACRALYDNLWHIAKFAAIIEDEYPDLRK